MINNDFKISINNSRKAIVSWTAAGPDYVSFVYINGIYAFGPIITGQSERSINIPFSSTLNKKIEIHEFPTNLGRPPSVVVPENSRPEIIWGRIDNAVRYRIYYQPADLSAPEKKIDEIFVRDNRDRHFVKSSVRLAEGFHKFRVESVDQFGNESTTASWFYRCYRLPEPVNDLTVSNGSGAGLFDITIS